MSLVVLGMRALEVIFFLGIAGSVVVILISSVEDVGELFAKEDDAPAADRTH